MLAKRFARACVEIVFLLFVVVAPVHAGLSHKISKLATDVSDSFGRTAYYPPVTGDIALLVPSLEINTIRQRLDALRMFLPVTGGPLPKVGFNGQALQVSVGSVLPTGGGASADKPDTFERWGVFLNADFDHARKAAVDAQLGFKVRTNNFTVGTDYRFPGNHVLGASVNYIRSDSDLDQGEASQDAKGYGFTLFGSYVPAPNGYIDAIVNVGHNKYDGERRFNNATFSNDTSGNQWASR